MGHSKLVLTDQTEQYPEFLKAVPTVSLPGVPLDKPVLFQMQHAKAEQAEQALEELVKTTANLEIIDNYAEQFAELLLSKNAKLYRASYDVQVASVQELLDEHYAGRPAWRMGTWVYFPWKNQLVHILAQDDFETLRTIRNRGLITEAEQTALLDAKVAVFGMSVGSASALALAISGISRNIKLIDGAVISGSNLNRILTGVSSVGKSKALVIGRQIYEMNPYSTIAYYDKVAKDSITDILDKPWKLDLVIDEIDDIEMKVRLRYEARKRKIPVIMATELADTVVLDIERYDLETDRELFHGMIPEIEDFLTKPTGKPEEWTKRAVRIIDPRNMTVKMQKSILEIGSSIVTLPQLGSTVMMTGGTIAFIAKNLITGGELKSGRYVISLEKTLLTDHQTQDYHLLHEQHTEVLQKAVDSM